MSLQVRLLTLDLLLFSLLPVRRPSGQILLLSSVDWLLGPLDRLARGLALHLVLDGIHPVLELLRLGRLDLLLGLLKMKFRQVDLHVYD